MRRSLTWTIGLALMLTACGPLDIPPGNTATTSVVHPRKTTGPDEPTTVPTDGDPDVPTTVRTVDDPRGTAWVHQEWSVPSDIEPYDAAWGDPGVVVLGYSSPHFDDSPVPNGLWLFDGESWTGELLREMTITGEYGFTPEVTDLVWFGGRYLAFLMGDSTTTPGRASMLASPDGRTWEHEYLGSAPAAALPAGLYGTPESPPYPGTSAVTGVAIHGDEITAAGWSVLKTGQDFVSVPVLWRSVDARTWSTTTLPNANFNNEWARDVAVGSLGYLVEVAGPVHQSAWLWYSPDGEHWTFVGDRFDDEWRMLVATAVGAEAMLALMMDLDDESQPLSLWRSTDGTTWEEVGSPLAKIHSAEGWWPVELVNDRAGLVALATTDGQTDMWRSVDGLSWTRLPSITLPGHDPSPWAFPRALVAEDRLALVATLEGKVIRWTETVGAAEDGQAGSGGETGPGSYHPAP